MKDGGGKIYIERGRSAYCLFAYFYLKTCELRSLRNTWGEREKRFQGREGEKGRGVGKEGEFLGLIYFSTQGGAA